MNLLGLCIFPQNSEVQAVLRSAPNLHSLMLVQTPIAILPEPGRSFQISLKVSKDFKPIFPITYG